jgi:branched-chain amino acid aminotransferase
MTDHMLEVKWNIEQGWDKPKIVPTHDFVLHPFNSTLHYAFEGFEGMKAYRDAAGKVRTFRPDMNAKRLVRTSEEICFPSFNPEEFVKCVDELVALDESWVPNSPSSLYLRPTIISLTNKLGVHPPHETELFVVGSPSGSYFKGGSKPTRLKVESIGVRAWPGGTGHVKAGANYTVGIKYVRAAFDAGFDQVVWLNGNNITEAGACNLFVYWINKKNERELVTPMLDGTILPGITRDSVLHLAREDKRFITNEKKISINDLVKAHKEKRIIEMFMCGTAVVVGPIGSVTYKDMEIIPQKPEGELSQELYKKLVDIQV